MKGLHPHIATAALALAFASSIRADPFVAPAPEDLSIYHVFIDRFANGSTANDDGNPRAPFAPSNPSGFHGGDLAGVRQKLPYIRGMGFNGLWLSPFLENTGNYHGYGTYNWYGVDQNFGTLAELQQLVADANAMGIAVYYDMVTNHCGDQIRSTNPGYPNFLAPPSEYTLSWRNATQYPAPFNSLSHFHAHGNIGTFDVVPEQELGELSGLDDLKTETQYVRDQMVAIWSNWLEQTGVSGFRVDTVKHVDMGFWSDFLPRLQARATEIGRGDLYVFGEVYGADDSAMAAYLGTMTNPAYRFDAALDFQFYYTAGQTFALATGPTGNMAGRILARQSALGQHHLVTPNFLDNHDVRRFMHVANNDNPGSGLAERLRRLDLGLTFMFTAPGPPVLYYGTEQGFDGGNDPNNREDMFDGLFESGPSLGDNFDTTATKYRLVKRLNEVRTALSPLRRGAFVLHQFTNSGPGILAYSRRHLGEEVLVVLNTATSAQSQLAVATNWPAGEVVVDALNPSDQATIGAGGTFPARITPAQGAQVWVRQSDLPATSPEVLSTTPANLEGNVDPEADLLVRFSVPMDPTSTEAAVSLSPATPSSYVWELGGTQLRINPTANLAPRTPYTLGVAATAESASGTPLLFPLGATFTTGRDFSTFPPIPPALAVIGVTPLSILVNGIDGDWAVPGGMVQDTWALSPQRVFVWRDAEGDDLGPGTYTYPTNSAFTGGDADLAELRVALTSTHVLFFIRPVSINPGASFFTPYFGVGIDLAPGGRPGSLGYDLSTSAVGVADLEVRPDASPEFELIFTGPAGAHLVDASGSLVPGTINWAYAQSTGVVEIGVPRAMLGLTGTLNTQQFRILPYSALETFGGIREVSTSNAAFTPGGGATHANDPDVFDLAGAGTADQLADLQDYDATIPPMVVRSIIPLALSDTQSAVGTWMLY